MPDLLELAESQTGLWIVGSAPSTSMSSNISTRSLRNLCSALTLSLAAGGSLRRLLCIAVPGRLTFRVAWSVSLRGHYQPYAPV